MDQDDKIFWPPDKEIAMSVLGFDEVKDATEKIVIDDEIIVDIASLSGIFLLKLIAFNERYLKGNKDADDMAFIITNYLSVNEGNAYENHYVIYEDEDFDTRAAGAKLLGHHLAELLNDNPDTKNKTVRILNDQIKAEEQSILINQILETHRSFSYEITLKCLEYIVKGLNDI
jgi:predicted nucleotidyltransferase